MHAEQTIIPGFAPSLGLKSEPSGADPDGLRPYQRAAVTAIRSHLREHRSTVIVMPTGSGKTQTFGAIAKHWKGRVLVLAHRDELLEQARRRLEQMTRELVDLEQAEWRASGSRLVVASVQTLSRTKRLHRFKPDAFTLIIVDEAHHAIASTYRRILSYFLGAKVLGVTATPDRGDERALGQVFETVAFRIEIEDLIDAGHLSPVRIHPVHIDAVDIGSVRTVAGDLSAADMEMVMATEGALHGVAQPLLANAGDRRTIVFHGPTVANAHRLTEVINRYRPGSARCVDGTTPDLERKAIFRGHQSGAYQFLVNVGIATEGYDDPAVSCIALARMTKSRALYAQMAGRGLRTALGKTDCLLLEFIPQLGRHVLVSPLDILGGRYDLPIQKRAKKLIEKTPGMRSDEALAKAEKQIKDEAARAAAKRAAVIASVRWRTESRDPFKMLRMAEPTPSPMARFASPLQTKLLKERGLEPPVDGWKFDEAARLLGEIKRRRDVGLCSYKMMRMLRKVGVDAHEMAQSTAMKCRGQLLKNKADGLGWKLPPEQVADIIAKDVW